MKKKITAADSKSLTSVSLNSVMDSKQVESDSTSNTLVRGEKNSSWTTPKLTKINLVQETMTGIGVGADGLGSDS